MIRSKLSIKKYIDISKYIQLIIVKKKNALILNKPKKCVTFSKENIARGGASSISYDGSGTSH